MADALLSRKGNDFVTRALRTLGVVQPSQSISDEVASNCLITLQELVDSWKAERLMIKTIDRHVYNVVSGQASYTVGPTGNFAQERPEIVDGAGIISTATSLELPLDELNDDEYMAVRLKTFQSQLPQAYFYDSGWDAVNGLANFYLLPIPNVGGLQVAIYTGTALTNFANGTTSYLFPPAYARAIHYNLVIELAPDFGKAIRPDLLKLAADSKATVERVNFKPIVLSIDDTAPGMRDQGGTYNFYTDNH